MNRPPIAIECKEVSHAHRSSLDPWGVDFRSGPGFCPVSATPWYPPLRGCEGGVGVVPPPPEPVVNLSSQPAAADVSRIWVRAEYLSYWVKNTPVPVSIVTGDINNPTQELLNSERSLGMLSGFRFGFGAWLDSSHSLGLETNIFALERQTRRFFASSDDMGNPILAFPFTNQTPGAVGDMLMPITSPGQFAGNIVVSSTLQLWGAETNGVISLARRGEFEFIGILGFRYLDLRENLHISTLSADVTDTVLLQSDHFNTRSQFFGGQIGGRLDWQGERFGFDLTGKLALGSTHQSVDIQGFSAQNGPAGATGVFPGGFFTQPSNIGRFSVNQFTVIPSVELKLYAQLTSHVRAFIGYDFMYWNQVVRPGSQIDRNINLTQSAIYGNGVLTGPASPTPLFNRTDFWAQDITFGLQFRF